MLLTTCPKCSAQFKVVTEQLNIRQGRVMCGRCRQIFDAFQSLTRGPDTTGPHVPLETTSGNKPSPLSPLAQKGATDSGLDLIDAPLDSPESAAPDPPTVHTVKHMAEPPVAVRDSLIDDDLRVPPVNPLLVEADARGNTTASRIGWSLGSLLLAVLLATQLMYLFRSDLAMAVPESRPWLQQACATVGCTLGFARDESAMRIEASDLVELGGSRARIQISATLANRGRSMQDFPALELRLTDNANQLVLSRSLAPLEYLGRSVPNGEGIAPGAEVFVNLTAELTPRMPASGYAVRAYYP